MQCAVPNRRSGRRIDLAAARDALAGDPPAFVFFADAPVAARYLSKVLMLTLSFAAALLFTPPAALTIFMPRL